MRGLDVEGRLPCQDRPELFGGSLAERPGSAAYKKRVREARSLCANCPAWQACRQLGRDLREHDVWGGEDDARRAAVEGPLPRYSASGADLRGTRTPSAA
jgi:hypothetical protein